MNQQNTLIGNKLLAEAVEQAKQGDLDQAIVTLKSLLQDNPNHEIALGMLGGIYAQINMHDRAIANFNAALAINPNNHLARLHLGMSLIETQKPSEAVAELEPLLELPGDFAGHYFAGIAHLQTGANDIALNLFEKAAENMPTDNPHYQDLQSFLDSMRK